LVTESNKRKHDDNVEEEEEKWLINSGALIHIICLKSKLINEVETNNSVKVRNGQELKANKKGTIIFFRHIGKQRILLDFILDQGTKISIFPTKRKEKEKIGLFGFRKCAILGIRQDTRYLIPAIGFWVW